MSYPKYCGTKKIKNPRTQLLSRMAHTRSNSRKPSDISQVVRQLDAVKKLERDLRTSQSEFSELQRKTSHEVSTVYLVIS